MSSSMHVCNPYCGRCKPPKEPMLVCAECGEHNDPTRGEFGSCKKCGADLPPRMIPTPEFCVRMDAVCANPCGQKGKPAIVAGTKCRYFTPVEKQ